MMNGGFTLPRLFGFPIFVSWSAVAILAIVVLRGGGVNTTSDLVRALVYAGIVFGSILVHELGHALVATRVFGLGPAAILLHGFGGVTRFRAPTKSWHAFVTALAGPSAGLLLGLLAAVVALLVPVPERFAELLDTVATINIFWSLFNLLPMLPLDGGNMLLHALQMATAPSTADMVARGVSVVVAIAAGAAGWFLLGSVFIPIVAALSIVQNVQSRRAA
jgi:stage IV sporulation protein FB